MPWHDRIADDRQEDGWRVIARWREVKGDLEVSRHRVRPDGRTYAHEYAEYENMTREEAQDVMDIIVWSLWHEQPELPFPN